MNRIKDFIYDISDILLGLAIVAAVIAIVGWKLTDSMSLNDKSGFTGITNDPGVSANPPLQTNPSAKPAGDAALPIADPNAVSPVVSYKSIVVTVKKGMADFKIAEHLKKQGVITDEASFLKTVKSMKAESKLRAGQFTLRAGMTNEEIIDVLSSKK